MNITTQAFREIAESALEELDADSEPTEIRRLDDWINRLARRVHKASADYSEGLGERDDEEDPDAHYPSVYGEEDVEE